MTVLPYDFGLPVRQFRATSRRCLTARQQLSTFHSPGNYIRNTCCPRQIPSLCIDNRTVLLYFYVYNYLLLLLLLLLLIKFCITIHFDDRTLENELFDARREVSTKTDDLIKAAKSLWGNRDSAKYLVMSRDNRDDAESYSFHQANGFKYNTVQIEINITHNEMKSRIPAQKTNVVKMNDILKPTVNAWISIFLDWSFKNSIFCRRFFCESIF